MTLTIIDSKDTVKSLKFDKIACCKCQDDVTDSKKCMRYYDEKGNWDGESYLCNKCYKRTYYSPTYEERQKYRDEKFKNRVCYICGSKDTYVGNSGTPAWSKYIDKRGKWDKKSYICKKCNRKKILEIERIDPDSHYNFMKSNSKYRMKGFDIDNSRDRFIIFEAVVCKVHGITDLNIDMDNFNLPIDVEHEKYRTIDVKWGSPDGGDDWGFHTRRKWNCDHYFCMGVDENWKNVEVVLIVPNEGWITDISQITIARYPIQTSKYDRFKVDPKPYNDAYHSLTEFLKDKKFFSIEDIREWLGS